MVAAETSNEGPGQPVGGNGQTLRHRVAIRFAVTGDMRFLSHRDMVRLFERALSRTDLPIRYSGGFNPRPRLWLLLPRSVGVASDDELLIVALEGPENPARILERLASQVPGAILLREAFELSCQAKPRPIEATYRLELAGGPSNSALPEGARRSDDRVRLIAERVRRVIAADRLEVRRTSRKGAPTRMIDLRGCIVRIDLADAILTMTLRIRPEGSARPAEVLELLGLAPDETLPRLRRVAVRWEGLDPEGFTPTDQA